MSSGDINYVRPSLLALLRNAGEGQQRPVYDRQADLDSLREEVRDHLRDLLNTRRQEPGSFVGYPEVARSYLTFGIPDLASMHAGVETECRRLAGEIQAAVIAFEPRLDPATVRVEHVKGVDTESCLRFSISATLRVGYVEGPVAFDTRIRITPGDVTVDQREQ